MNLRPLLESIIYQGKNNFVPDIRPNIEYEYPNRIESIKSKLVVQNVFNIDHYLKINKKNEARRIFIEIENSFYHQGMNPHKSYEVLNFFIESNLDKQILKEIRDSIEFNESATILHIGNKGSGKTLSQNIFLHRNFQELEKNNIIWVRCDAHKLYNLWREHLNSEQLQYSISIEEYLDIQFVYVFCKYLDVSELFKRAYDLLEANELKFPVKKSHSHQSELEVDYELRSVKDYIQKYRYNIKTNEPYSKHEYSYALDEIIIGAFKSNKQRAKTRWIKLSKSIQNFLSDNGFRFLFVVDGIDNVNMALPSAKGHYELMKNQFASFIKKKPPTSNITHLASLRPRTRIEVDKILFTETMSGSIHSKPWNPTYIFQEQYDMTLLTNIFKKRCEYVKSRLKLGTSQDSNIIYKILEFVVSKDLGNKEIDDEFHENCRNYLFNRLNLVKHIYHRYLIRNSPQEFNIENAYTNFSSLCLFLNSRIFLNSRQEPNTEDGDFGFNIFYFPTNKNLKNFKLSDWNGLCGVRILQLLKSNIFIINCYDKITSFLVSSFNYPKELIDYFIQKLRDFGMIDSYIHVDELSLKKTLEYKISKKGNKLFKLSFSSIQVLYHFSLDSLIPIEFVNKSKIDGFSSDIARDFIINMIKSTIAFIGFLRQVEISEHENCVTTSESKIGEKTYLENFKLPFEYNFLDYLRQFESYLDLISKSSQISLLNILKGESVANKS